jgi:protein-tyrosine phosphatase
MIRDRREVAAPFDKLSNFRDVGGLQTVNGQTFKSGMLFRSDELSRATARDLARLQALDLKLICDLRSPQEGRMRQSRRLREGSIQIAHIPLHAQATQDGSRRKLLGFLFGKSGGEQFRAFSRDYYHHIAFEQTSRIRELITLLAKEGNLPALIHCTAGKDRTGFVAAVIQLLVGVPHEVVMAEYLRTNDSFAPRLEKAIKVMRVVTLFQVSPERMRLILMAHPEFLAEVRDRIFAEHGSIEGYLRDACEIDRDTLQRLKAHLLG